MRAAFDAGTSIRATALPRVDFSVGHMPISNETTLANVRPHRANRLQGLKVIKTGT